ncbi:MAG: BNR-repeat neuraminidase N-terminal domain-containing protein, partial [Bacteroidota bacterium]
MKNILYILFAFLALYSNKPLMATEITIGTGTNLPTYYPFDNYWENNKTQMIYLQSEIGTATTITNLSLNFERITADATRRDFSNFTIKLMHTSSSSFSGAYINTSSATTVLSSTTFNMPASTGWYSFDINDFDYNGTDNLIIEIYWGDNNEYAGSTDTYRIYSSTTSSNSVAYGYDDYTTQPTYDGQSTSRPNIKLTCTSTAAMSYVSSTTTQASTADAISGQSNQEILRVEVVTTGSISPLSATSFTFNTTGSSAAIDITNAKLYYTGSSSSFAATTQVGSTYSTPSGSFTITPSQTLLTGSNYFWLCYDISATATASNILDAQCTSITIGTAKTPTATNPTGSRTIVTYGTIGIADGDDNYASPFAQLYTDGRQQYIITASELTALGFSNGTVINGLSFNVTTKYSSSPFLGFYIKIGHSASSSFSSAAFLSPTFTTCYSADYTSASGWNFFTFTSNFTWNGSDNIVIQTCWNNSSYTDDDYVATQDLADYKACYGRADGTTGCSMSATNRSITRPIIRLYSQPAVTIGTVTTTSITTINTTTASSGGKVTSQGGSSISARGVCWNTSTDPTISNSKTTNGTGTGVFTSSITGLASETNYYVRAYATNTSGTAYGANVNLWTLSTEPSGHATSFTATAISSIQIDLAFNAASTYGADGYIILRKADASAPDETNITDGIAPASLSLPGGVTLVTTITSNSTTSYSNTSLSGGTQYYYAIIPFNWNASNTETYNYRTSATISTATATTPEAASTEGLYVTGNVTNNGTIDQRNDDNYITMSGTTKIISGEGIYDEAKLHVAGEIAFDGIIASGSFTKTFIDPSKKYTLNSSKTFINGLLTNSATGTLDL